MNKLLLGSHVSFKSKEYLLGSVKESIQYNSNCFMIFTGPPQNFNRKDIDLQNVKLAHNLMKENGIKIEDIVVHAPYLINLGSPKIQTRLLGLKQLILEINRTKIIGSKLLVLHPGSSLDLDKDESINYVIHGINEAIKQTDNDVIVCIETMAGKGSEIGRNFKEISKIINGVKDKKRIGVCLDTCHMHESGINISSPNNVLNEFEKYLAFDYIKVIHLNDSKNEIGARKDRHENIGYGKIGFDILVSWAHNERLSKIPKILETPYRDDKPIYKEEIIWLNTKKWGE